MTTTHVRIHWADDIRASYDPEPIERTVWFDGDIETAGVREGWSDLDLCEVIWSRFNRHDAPDQHPVLDELGLRSLCVGDVVEIRADDGPRFYICAPVGWNPIEGVRSKTPQDL